MDMENKNHASVPATGACKRYFKKVLAGVVALAVLGGCGIAWSAHQKDAEHAAKDAARTQLIAAQAAREDVTLISEDEAKAKAAEAVGVEETTLTFQRVGLENLALERKDGGKNDHKDKKEFKHSEMWHGAHDGEEEHERDNHERDDHDGMWQHERDDHDGTWHEGGRHEGAPMGQPPQGMMQGAPQDGQVQPMQGQPPMMQGAPQGQVQDGQQAQSAAADGPQAQAAQETNGQPPMQHRNFRFHPAYQIACSHGDVRYHVMVDAVTGDVMHCDVA